MSIATLSLLLLFPLIEWLSWSAFLPSIRRAARLASPKIFKESLTTVFLFSGRAHLLIYLALLFGTGTWLWSNGFTWTQVGVTSAFGFRNLLLGTICGVAFFGGLILISVFQRKLVPHAQFLWEVPALYSLGYTRWILLFLGAASLEIWRAATVTSLVNDSFSLGTAVLLSAGIYALRLMPRGPYRVAYGAFEGLVFGGVYVWLGSVVAPLSARLACDLAMFIFFRGTVPAPPDFSRPVVAHCPLCERGFALDELHLRQSLTCPDCLQVIGLPSWREPLVKFSLFAGLVGFLALLLEFSPGGKEGGYGTFFLGYIGAFLATIGVVVLINLLSLRGLKPGSPGIPTLGLTSNTKKTEEPDNESPVSRGPQ
ncbi:MAG TPA: hypothetical protein VN982_02945 [Candidatus Dormibacteraeota bacterium]|nr:hypothetical protein [Candidatus Dormibacteraeota bacterium]